MIISGQSLVGELWDQSMDTTKVSRAQQRARARRAILDEAANQFAHFGFEGASLNVIAKNSKISKQNIVYYFGSKEELWKATVDDLFEQVNQDLERAAIAADGTRPLDQLITSYYEIARRYPAYVLIPMLEGINNTWRSELLAKSYLAPHIQGFESTIRTLVEAGEIKEVDPLHLQNLVTGGAQLFLALAPLWAHAINADTTSETFLEKYANTVSKLLTL